MSANNKPDERFTDFSFADLIAFRQETIRSNREIPDRTNMEFVKDIDAELKRRNDGPSIPHNRILNKPQQEKKPNGSEY